MTDTSTVRLATAADIPALEALIAASVRALSVGFYTPEQIESGLRFIFGVDSQLIADGTYYVIDGPAGPVACGGWSRRATLYGGDQHKAGADPLLDPAASPARIRAFFVHPEWARRGLATRLITACADAAAAAGFRSLELAATLPGEPLYAALGFAAQERSAAKLPDGVALPIVRMTRPLASRDPHESQRLTPPPAPTMFTPAHRAVLRDALLAAARDDARISGGALTGSAALDREDEWSDIDLAFAVAAGADRDALVADFTARMYGEHDAVHHTDVIAGRALFRVFLLRNTLQVDLAFWPEEEFGAIGPTFRLLFGSARERPRPPAPTFESLVGMGWLYALHARSSIERGRAWQAEHMIGGVRDHVISLACLRHGLPTAQGRGVDRLPAELLTTLDATLVRSLDASELRRAFAVACARLLDEAEAVDPDLARRLKSPLERIAALASPPPLSDPPVEVVRTDRLALRRLSTDDADFIVELVNDPDWLRYIGDRGIRTPDDARRYILNGPMAMYERLGFGLWGVMLRESGALIGMCGLLKRDALENVDIGFAFLPRYRSRGYAYEAAAATLEHGRRVLGLSRIVAIVSPENEASMRLLRKLGLELERRVQLAPGGKEVCLFGPAPAEAAVGRPPMNVPAITGSEPRADGG